MGDEILEQGLLSVRVNTPQPVEGPRLIFMGSNEI